MKKEELVKNELTDIQKLLLLLNLFGFKPEEVNEEILWLFKQPAKANQKIGLFCEYKLSTFLYGIDDKIILNLMKIFSEKIKIAGFYIKYIESNCTNTLNNIRAYYVTICFSSFKKEHKDFHKKIGRIEKISKELAVKVADEIIYYKDMLGLLLEKDAEEIKCFFDAVNKKCVINPDRGFFKLQF
jgi:hypothetical protein